MRWWKSFEARGVLGLGAAIAGIYGFPGYMGAEGAEQLYRARGLHVADDRYPPLMAWYWHQLERLVHGPAPMFALQLGLVLWGCYGLVRTITAPRTAAIATVAVLLCPPVLAQLAVVSLDAQMVAWLVAGTMLALRPAWRARVAGVIALAIGATVQHGGLAAAVPLAIVIAASWQQQRLRAAATALAIIAGLAAFGAVVDRTLTARQIFPWYREDAVFDISRTMCDLPELSDDAVRSALSGMTLRADDHLQAALCGEHWREQLGVTLPGVTPLFVAVPYKPERMARREAWSRLLREHTGAFVHGRLAVTSALLAGDMDPVTQSFTAGPEQIIDLQHDWKLTRFQHGLGKLLRVLSRTPLFAPYAYLTLALALIVVAVRRRAFLVAAFASSGVLCELAVAVTTEETSFQASLWLVTSAVIATALAVVIARRPRAS